MRVEELLLVEDIIVVLLPLEITSPYLSRQVIVKLRVSKCTKKESTEAEQVSVTSSTQPAIRQSEVTETDTSGVGTATL